MTPRSVPTLALVAALLLGAGCPRARSRTQRRTDLQLPAIDWSIQLEGDPWPYGVSGENLLVWTYRFADAGFLFPIKLESYAADSGKANWSIPIRPWLWTTDAPWSFNIVQTQAVLGAWVKGNVARTVKLSDGGDAWSIPLCNGLVGTKDHLVAATERSLQLLQPLTGRIERQIELPSPLAAPPILIGGQLIALLEGQLLVAVDLKSGRILWRQALGGAGALPDRPHAAGALILIPQLPSEAGHGKSPGQQVAVLEARRADTGALVWRKRIAGRATAGQASPLGGLRVAGDLLLLTQSSKRCLLALELSTGRQRFRRCGLHLSTPPVRHGNRLYALGSDAQSRAALARGEPWYAVDFPLLTVDTRQGKTQPVILKSRRGRAVRRQRPVRAVRLQILPLSSDVIYLLQKHRFLSALRVGKADSRQ
ncbi:MAG: PQQ-binding-like beta-propeller repeat protein [bacterium]